MMPTSTRTRPDGDKERLPLRFHMPDVDLGQFCWSTSTNTESPLSPELEKDFRANDGVLRTAYQAM